MKDGSTLFTDLFNDGIPPQMGAPNFADGTAASYHMSGAMGPEVNNPTGGPGQLTMNSSGAILTTTAVGTSSLLQEAVLNTGISANSHELTSSDTFSVTGVFNLVVPTSPESGYGIVLTDKTTTSAPDAWVSMQVARNASDQLVIDLLRQNFQAGTFTVIGFTPLDTSHTDEIALTLTYAGSDGVTGSFYYIDPTVTGSSTTLGTTNIFDVKNFTEAGFEAFAAVPEPSAMLFLVPGLVGLAAVRRRLKK
jgi:hypothetical protein